MDLVHTDHEDIPCEEVHNVDWAQQCEFIINNTECHSDENFIAYSTFVYCTFGSGTVIPPLVILAVGLILLFIALGVTADDFLTPSLISISKTLRLSQNIAGVTLLAFGNGAPDIISSIAGVGQARPALVVGELLGAGTFVTCVVVGSICLTQNFKIMERPFLRDIIFYIGATYWAFCVFYKQKITLFTSIGFIVVYLVYIVVVVVSSIIYQRHKAKLLEKEQRGTSQEAFTDLRRQINSISNTLDFIDGLPKSVEVVEGAEMPDDPEFVGLVLRRSSFRNYVRRRKTTLSGNRSRSNSRASGRSTPGNSRVNSRANSRANSRTNSISSTCRSRANSVLRRPSEPKPNQLTPNYGFDNPVFTVTAATPTATPRTEFKFPTNGDLSHSFSGEFAEKRTLDIDRSLSNGTRGTQNMDYPEDPDALDGGAEEEKVVELQPFEEFLTQISPIDAEDWEGMSWFWRGFTLVKAPLYIILALTTPVKDNDNHKNNWCRLLNVLHCVTSPLALCFVSQTYASTVGDELPVPALVFIGGLCLAALVFFTSKHEEPPVYHSVYAFVGFVVSVSWVYVVANEVVSLLKTFGIVLKLTDAFLGMTVLAWGNSIGDFIANLSVARQGYPRMAISACFGGPLLNLLLGFGLPYTYKLLSESDESYISLEYKWIIGLLYATVCQSLVSTMVVLFILGFESRKEFGFYLILLYVVFFLVTVVVEITGSTPAA
ncbi:mitochondrial sodium/calcium exchanger protein [Galendromus occidentalis]|uniref:Mitochondrial sodium/calcium exchanger protein n=1 Tax=Galendromus occidentalis TaxID=34638 RepID=A0AAJ6W081_9ACAR|nr:mitochondrial sodium/calcium exchanger protein [Galendromus occidentalis]